MQSIATVGLFLFGVDELVCGIGAEITLVHHGLTQIFARLE